MIILLWVCLTFIFSVSASQEQLQFFFISGVFWVVTISRYLVTLWLKQSSQLVVKTELGLFASLGDILVCELKIFSLCGSPNQLVCNEREGIIEELLIRCLPELGCDLEVFALLIDKEWIVEGNTSSELDSNVEILLEWEMLLIVSISNRFLRIGT